DDATKSTAADNNRVELPLPTTDRLSGAVERLLQGVAEEPPHIVQGEGRGFGTECHDFLASLLEFPPHDMFEARLGLSGTRSCHPVIGQLKLVKNCVGAGLSFNGAVRAVWSQ